MRIGVFDSGLGGLTVAREIKKRSPGHTIVYIGDTERIPWGVRSPRVIKKFSLQLLRFLEKKNVDLVVVACHTASSVAIPFLKSHTKLPVYGVIEPAAQAVAGLGGRRVGILGTPATVRSKSWERAIRKRKKDIKTFALSAPLLVPIVEEGLEKHEIARKMIEEYTKKLLEKRIDTLVLACTHYPLILDAFRMAVGDNIELVNPGVETAKGLEISDPGEIAGASHGARDEFYFTDLSDRVKKRLAHFYGRRISGPVREVVVEEI